MVFNLFIYFIIINFLGEAEVWFLRARIGSLQQWRFVHDFFTNFHTNPLSHWFVDVING